MGTNFDDRTKTFFPTAVMLNENKVQRKIYLQIKQKQSSTFKTLIRF